MHKSVSGLLISGFLSCLPGPAFSQVMSQGPLNPAAVTYEALGCLACPGSEWQNPGQAMLPDSQFAAVSLAASAFCFQTSCYYSRGLIATEFGFTIPLNATVTGVAVEVLRKGLTSNAIYDSSVYLLKNMVIAGTPKVSPDPWPLLPQYQLFGDTADLWGASWTPAEINSKQFGVFLKAMNKSGVAESAEVDHIGVTVYYTVPVSAHSPKDNPPVSLFYNPAALELIVCTAGKSAEGVLVITEGTGKKVVEVKISVRESSRRSFSLYGLAPGVYIVSLFTGGRGQYLRCLVPGNR